MKLLTSVPLLLGLLSASAEAATFTLEASGRLRRDDPTSLATKTGDSSELFSRFDSVSIGAVGDPGFQAFASPTAVSAATSQLENGGGIIPGPTQAAAASENIPIAFSNLEAIAAGASEVEITLNFALAGIFFFPPEGSTFDQAAAAGDWSISLSSSVDRVISTLSINALVNRSGTGVTPSGSLVESLRDTTDDAGGFTGNANAAVPITVALDDPNVLIDLRVDAFSFKIGGGFSQTLVSLGFSENFATDAGNQSLLDSGVFVDLPVTGVPIGNTAILLFSSLIMVAGAARKRAADCEPKNSE